MRELVKGLDAWRRSQTGWTSGNAGRRVWNSSVQEKQGGEYRTAPKLPRRPSCEATSARPRQPEGQIDENFGQDHLHRVIVTTGLDNIEALDPRSVFPGGSRKFLQFPIFPKVGPKLGEQRRTQVSTSASSGDLQPPLGEELRAPSGARPACCPPLQLAVLRSLGERRDQVPGEPPAVLGDHAYHQVPLFPNCVVPAASIPAVACSSMPHCPGVLLQQLGRLPCNAHDGYAYHCI